MRWVNIKLVLIDPSNSTFCSHFGNSDIGKFLAQIPKFEEIKTLPANIEFQIYTPNGIKGTQPNEYRDCVDIAVKLAFGFNLVQEDFNLKKLKESIMEHPVVMAISNNDSIDKNFIAGGYAFRIKQTSDFEKVKLVNNFEIIINSTMKFAAATDLNNRSMELRTELDERLELEDMCYNNTDPDIVTLTELSKFCITAQTELLGEIEAQI